jgi:thioredoxin-dependent peroxiredoxin
MIVPPTDRRIKRFEARRASQSRDRSLAPSRWSTVARAVRPVVAVPETTEIEPLGRVHVRSTPCRIMWLPTYRNPTISLGRFIEVMVEVSFRERDGVIVGVFRIVTSTLPVSEVGFGLTGGVAFEDLLDDLAREDGSLLPGREREGARGPRDARGETGRAYARARGRARVFVRTRSTKYAPAAETTGRKETPMIEEGSKFPDFSLQDQEGKSHSLGDYAGKWMVVYFYPKDDTPGCTIEGQSFTAARPRFDERDTAVLGVSEDDVDSHKAFCDKYDFDLTLLADTDTALYRACGIGQSEYKGTMYWDRVTVIVDPEGTVRRVYPKVSVQGHEQQVLEDLAGLQEA